IGKVNESSGASQVLTSNIAKLAEILQDPETIKAAQDLAAGVVGALNKIIDGAKETVRIVQWASEELAYQLSGGMAASDDIVRLNESLADQREELAKLEKARDNLRALGLKVENEDPINKLKADIRATEALIENFYKSQEKKPPVEAPKVSTSSQPGKSGGKTGTVNAEAAATAGTKKLTEAQKAAKKAAQELAQAQKENIDT
ncbi:hypothetical protein, partial [Pseudomonas aeruginosa]